MYENRPVVLVVESDVFLRSRLGACLREQSSRDTEIVEAASAHEAGRVLDALRDDSRTLLSAVIGYHLADGSATMLAPDVAALHPGAKRLVVASSEDEEAARVLGFDGVVTAADLSALTLDGTGPHDGIQVVGRRYGERTYEIKDFLYRNMVPFTWHSVDVPSGAALAARLGLPEPVPTTVVLADGSQLRKPTLVDLADALGFVEPARRTSYDLVIVGGGPAGLAAAVYGACEGLSVVVADGNAPGGQAGSTSRIENYLGFPGGLSGADLAHRALRQARQFGVQWLVGHTATKLTPCDDGHVVHTDGTMTLHGRAVLLAPGMRWRCLDAPGAERFANRGIYHGASLSEAAQTAGEDVYVVGAGNSAGQAALYFADHARSLTLLVRGDSLADSPMSQYLVERIEAHLSITVRTGTVITEAMGDDRLAALTLRNVHTGQTERVPAKSVYVLIGMAPCTDWLDDSIALDRRGFVLTGESVSHVWPDEREPLFTETSVPGVFAAGDVCAGTVKRVGAAVGQGAMAMHAISLYLRGNLARRIPVQAPVAVRQFDLLDADANGYVEQQDLTSVAQRLLQGFGESPGTVRGGRVVAAYADFWTTLADVADVDGDHRITHQEFDAAITRLSDSPVFRGMAEAVVALCDTDDDGAINEAEFDKALAILGVPIQDVGQFFRALDADGSGYLDTAEIAEALRQFYAGAALLTAGA